MPRPKLRLSTAECKAYRDRLLRLRKMHIATGPTGDLVDEPARLLVEQLDHQPGSLYQLPLGEVALIVSARLTVLTSGVVITDAMVTTSWADLSLDLSDAQDCAYDPKECSYLEGLASDPFDVSSKCFNAMLTRGVPLLPQKEYGVIFAKGWGSIPVECKDGSQIPVRIILTDHRNNQLSFNFDVLIDRSIERKYQPRMRPRPKRLGLAELLSGERLTGPSSTAPAHICLEPNKRLQRSLKDSPRQASNETVRPSFDCNFATPEKISMKPAPSAAPAES